MARASSASGDARWMSASEADTMRFAAAFAAQLEPGQVVALHGAFGAGKTCFVRGVAEGLGIDPRAVSSPTFTICHEHASPLGFVLVHVDAWRLTSPDELDELGWEEIIARRDVVACVEWAERLGERMPAERIEVVLAPVADDEQSRTIEVRGTRRLIEAMRVVSPIPALPPSSTTCATCGGPLPDPAVGDRFCSERCRLADLHRWFSGEYRVEGGSETDWEEEE